MRIPTPTGRDTPPPPGVHVVEDGVEVCVYGGHADGIDICLFDEGDTFPLGGKSASALDRIFTVAQKLNGLRDEDVDELAKNSSAGQSDDSPSD